MSTCQVCGNPFEARRKDALFCGPTCRKRYERTKSKPVTTQHYLPIHVNILRWRWISLDADMDINGKWCISFTIDDSENGWLYARSLATTDLDAVISDCKRCSMGHIEHFKRRTLNRAYSESQLYEYILKTAKQMHSQIDTWRACYQPLIVKITIIDPHP